MAFALEKMIDLGGSKYWILYEHGRYHCPVAIISDVEMISFARQVLSIATEEDIGIRLRRYRKSRRLTQADLAKELGISRTYLSMIERGESNLSASIFNKIIEVID